MREEMRLRFAAERFRALEVMRTHHENHIVLLHDLARELPRAVSSEIDAMLERDQYSAVGRGRTVPRARAGARDFEVDEATFDCLTPGNALSERAATCVARADEKDLHSFLHVSDKVRGALTQRRRGNRPGPNDSRSLPGAINDGRWI